MNLAAALVAHPAMAILRGVAPREVLDVAEAVAQAGWRAVEVPLNRPFAYEAIELLATGLPEICVGAGTLTSPEQAARVRDVGGSFAVSPHLDVELLDACSAAGLDTMPGVLTPSEAFRAHRLGRTHVKVFPYEALGPRGLRALVAVAPEDLVVTAVGGITAEDAAQALAHGAHAVGIASWLFRPGDPASEVARRAQLLSDTVSGRLPG